MRLKMMLASLAAGATMLAAGSADASVLLIHASGTASGYDEYGFLLGVYQATYSDVAFSLDVSIDLSKGTRSTGRIGPIFHDTLQGAGASNPGAFTETIDGKTVTGASKSVFNLAQAVPVGPSQFRGDFTMGGIVSGFWVQYADARLFTYETIPSGNLCIGATTCRSLLSSGSIKIEAQLDTFTVTEAPVPEPASWALMILGFGLAGATLRRREAPGPSGSIPN